MDIQDQIRLAQLEKKVTAMKSYKMTDEEINKSFNQEEKDLIKKAFNNDIEKGGKKAILGEIRRFGGRDYIKTNDGWKFHGKGTGAKAQEHAAGAKGKEETIEERNKRHTEEDKAEREGSFGLPGSKPKTEEESLGKDKDGKELKAGDRFNFEKKYSNGRIEHKQGTITGKDSLGNIKGQLDGDKIESSGFGSNSITKLN